MRRTSRPAMAGGIALVVAGVVWGTVEVVGARDADDREPRVGSEVPVTTNDLRRTRAQNSPVVLADPTEARFVALANRWDAPQFSCALQLSGDGGRSWLEVDPVPELPPGAEKCYAPEIAFDDDGVLHYLFIGLQGAGNSPMGVFLTSSPDRGRTFRAPRQVLGPGNYQVRMAIDRTQDDSGRIHLVWLQTSADSPLGGLPEPPNPIVAAHSDDGGRTFSRPIPLSQPDQLAVAPAVATGPDERVHVLYYDLEDDLRDYQGLEGPTWDGTWSLVHTASTDGGRHFSEPVVVDEDLVPPERVMLIYTMPPPALAVDRSGKVFAAWYDARNGDWDVFLRRSADGGSRWGRPLRLNDDPPGRHQYLPRVSVAGDGRIDAVFYDRRRDPDNIRNDVYYTSSTDGGRRFSPNLKLTSRSSSSRVGQQYTVPSATGLTELGSRIGLHSAEDGAVVAWADTHSAGDSVQQDIYATELHLPATHRPSLVLPAVVVAMGVVVLAVALFGRRSSGRVGAGAATLLAVVLASCQESSPSGYLPGAPPSVAVSMRDFRFEHERPIPGGRVVFEVTNAGGVEHELILAPIPEGYPPIDEQVRGAEQRILLPLYYLRSIAAGTRDSFAVELTPGRYAMVCFVSGADGKAHAVSGMTSEFTVA